MTKSKSRAIEPDENKARLDEEDVEGHTMKSRATEPDELLRSGYTSQGRVSGDDEDVEGHTMRATEPDELLRSSYASKTARISGDDEDDVEGHIGNSQFRSPASKGE